MRAALLSSFTLDPLSSIVGRRVERSAVEVSWYVAGFNQYASLILDVRSDLYAFSPDLVFVAVAAEDLFQGLRRPWQEDPAARSVEAERRISELERLIRFLGEQLPHAKLFVHTFVVLEPQPHPLLAYRTPATLQSLAVRANAMLYRVALECENVVPLDLAGVVATGLPPATDPRILYLAGMRLGREAMDALASHYRRAIEASLGRRKKCIVVDLDDTLWGGVLGEQGVDGLQLGPAGLGRAYHDVQEVLLGYRDTGILLAVCSKNDEDLALSAMRAHPHMVLRPEHFAALRINWSDKAQNIREIADELNIGIDSVVFVDDSAHERAWIREALPEVTVVELPRDPVEYPGCLATLPHFDTLSLTVEDRRRPVMYAEERQRDALRRASPSLAEFLAGLQIRVRVRRAALGLVPRLAQLSAKTNQFNLTARRYSEGQLSALLGDVGHRVYAVDVSDKLGDSGIVGMAVVVVDESSHAATLDNFLLSCRVLGRGVESASLAGILIDLKSSVTVRRVDGAFHPTKRNGIASDFLPRHGFEGQGADWHRSLEDVESLCPAWIELIRDDSTS